MTVSHVRLAPLALAAACALAGCDQDSGSTMDYEAVVHVEVAEITKVPFVAKAIADSSMHGDTDLESCRDAVLSADALTVGTGNGAFELYLTGALDKAAIDDCQAAIESAKVERSGDASKMTTKTHWISPTVFAVVGAEGTLPVPSEVRLDGLRANDPTPTTAAPSELWVVARDDAGKKQVSHVQAWADMSKGIDAHVDVEFDSVTDATKIYGQAMLGLSALRASGEIGDFGDAIALSHGGDTLTVDVHATKKQLDKIATKIQADKAAHGPSREKTGKSGLRIEIGTGKDAD